MKRKPPTALIVDALGFLGAVVYLVGVAAIARGQDYRLVIFPGSSQATAVSGTVAYGHHQYVPVVHEWRTGVTRQLWTPGAFPGIVLDAAGPVAVGVAVDLDAQVVEGVVWTDETYALVERRGYRHAWINGTDGHSHVGRLSGPGGPYATRWDEWGAAHDLHPPAAHWSLAEDTRDGLVCGVVDDTASVWVTDFKAVPLSRPRWATVQTWAFGLAGPYVVGYGTGATYTRPLAWIDGAPVELAPNIGFACDTNADGLTVGWVGDGLSSVGVVWNLPDATATDLNVTTRGIPPGVQIIAAYAVSDAGHIAVECSVWGESMGGVLVCRRVIAGGKR